MKNIVLTFDDCYDSHLLLVKPLLEELDFKATFFVSGYYLGTCKIFKREHLREFERNGFELGNHLF
jgi:peptidoglycan/xylan/chitin deacetylase (PgdA/CDA1 family)